MSGTRTERVALSRLPTQYGVFDLRVYRSISDGREHVALVMGNVKKGPIVTRLHSQCLTGDTLLSLRCDCREQLHMSMQLIAESGTGVLLYLPQEGRGIGLSDKIRAYALQDQGVDTVEANEVLGLPNDMRNYLVAAEILKDLGITEVRLITNNPDKERQLTEHGINITETIRASVEPNEHNKRYIETKRRRMGHVA